MKFAMKDFIFILGFLCHFVINTAAGHQTWKEERSNVMGRFSELYKKDVKLEKTQDNQNDKIIENKNELEDLRLLVKEQENEIHELKEKATEQEGTNKWLISQIVELQKLTVNNQNNINNNYARITINSGKYFSHLQCLIIEISMPQVTKTIFHNCHYTANVLPVKITDVCLQTKSKHNHWLFQH